MLIILIISMALHFGFNVNWDTSLLVALAAWASLFELYVGGIGNALGVNR